VTTERLQSLPERLQNSEVQITDDVCKMLQPTGA